MSKLITIVEDEQDIRELVSLHLSKSGFEVKEFQNGKEFLDSIEKKPSDLVILDLMLPDIDGIEICKSLRQDSCFRMIPIIMLTAKGDESDKVIGLELGADDYVTKPFSPKELVARVKAVLRRFQESSQGSLIKVQDFLTIDSEKYEVKVKEKKISLTQAEFKILKILASRIGRVYSREEILDHVWGQEKVVIDRTVDVHVKHLREKLGKAGELIKNVRGVGYKLEL